MEIINLDNCSTTKVYPEVLKLHTKLSEEYYYNTNAMSDFAFQTNNLLQLTKNKIKRLLNYNGDVVFTPSATFANNIIIQGFFKNNVNKVCKVITTKVEHPSILNVVENLGDDVEKVYLEYTQSQEFAYDLLAENLSKGPALVTTCLVNNTTGIIIDYVKIAQICKKYNSFLHLDITQALCKMDFDPNIADLLSCSMHKIGGLKGCGLILKNKHVKLEPIMYGGSGDSILMPGTTNSPAYITMAKTIELAQKDFENSKVRITKLQKYLVDKLQSLPFVNVNDFSVLKSTFITTFSLKKLTSEIILNYLDQHNIIVSSGSACSSKVKSSTEEILKNYNIKKYKNTLRICFNYQTQTEDIDKFIAVLEKGLRQL